MLLSFALIFLCGMALGKMFEKLKLSKLLGMLIFGPMLLGISVMEAAIMGTVVAAVSTAVIVPRMLQLMECGYGTNKSIPQMILAGASVDDVFVILQQKKHEVSKRLSSKFSKLWVGAELLLFGLVGATVNISYALRAGILAIILIFCVLLFRIVGVFLCLIKTNLNKKERIFTVFAYMPKATVQAAIGGLPISNGTCLWQYCSNCSSPFHYA